MHMAHLQHISKIHIYQT